MRKTCAAVCSLILCLFVFGGCSLSYSGEETEDGRFFIGYSKVEKRAFVGMITVEADENGAIITVPDEYKGFPLTTLGGEIGRGYPCPFAITVDLPAEYNEYVQAQKTFSASYAGFDETGDGWETIAVTVRLGVNVTKAQWVDGYASYTGIFKTLEDGTEIRDILYHAIMHFEVDEANKVFYADEGKLYFKSNSRLVEGIDYE